MADETQDRAEEIMAAAMAQLAAVIAEDTGRDQPICTNWVLVAEWSTLDGEQWVSRWWDDKRPTWQRDGLLHHALNGNWRKEAA